MKPLSRAAACVLLLGLPRLAAAPVHVWEKQEVTLTAERSYANPYTDVVVWLDLSGPGFDKRV